MLFACGLLATSTPVYAQTTADSSSWFMGHINLMLLGRSDVASSKFEEYRTVPQGVSVPNLSLLGSQKGMDFALYGSKIALDDQRYTGFVKTNWLGVAFDYNQIMHNMGNDGHTMFAETAPGVWSMSSTLRGTLGAAIDAKLPTSARTYPFYSDLYAPTLAAANPIDISSLRKRGTAEFDLGQKLPFDLKATYMREAKTGSRGPGGGEIYGVQNVVLEVPWALNEVTQDIGFRAALNKAWGNVYGAYNHNWYNNLQEITIIDNPIRATDLTWVSASVPGGSAQGRLFGPPDNSADNGSFGAMFKFGRQTRVTADLAFGQWLQNAPLDPYTINSTIFVVAGANPGPNTGLAANSLAALDAQSMNGKIDTRMYNFAFSSRPLEGLGVRLRYRSYDVDNKTNAFVRTGSAGSNVDLTWSPVTAQNLAESEFGYETASPYGYKTGRFDAQGSYDIKAVTIEGTYRHEQIDRTFREGLQNKENGGSVAVIVHHSTWLMLRGMYDQSTRLATKTGNPDDSTSNLGFQADESERHSKVGGIDVEITPSDKVMFLVSYLRHNDDYPNRPDQVSGGVVVPGTPNGLLKANYDTYTVEVDWTPNARAEVGAYYTYDKDLSTTQTGGTSASNVAPGAGPIANLLTWDGSNKANTFGLNSRFALSPDKWMFNFDARRQKVDGLMAITGDQAGSFYRARAAYGGIQNVNDYNDTDLTTIVASFDYNITKAVGLNFGYAYEKYKFADAYSQPTNELYPLNGSFYLKANHGSYEVNDVVYVKMNYRW